MTTQSDKQEAPELLPREFDHFSIVPFKVTVEQQIKPIRERLETYLTGTIHVETYREDVELLLSIVESQEANGGRKTPFCAVHAALEQRDGLVLEVGNDCVACSLHERTTILNMLEPFAPDDGSQDSLTVLQRLIDGEQIRSAYVEKDNKGACECACHVDAPYCPRCNKHCVAQEAGAEGADHSATVYDGEGNYSPLAQIAIDRNVRLMRSACVQKVRGLAAAHRQLAQGLTDNLMAELQRLRADECDAIESALESLTLQEQEQ